MEREKLVDVINKVHNKTGVNDSETLELDITFKDQGYDSLDMVEFLMEVERELNINIKDEALVDINTPNDFIGLLEKETEYKSFS